MKDNRNSVRGLHAWKADIPCVQLNEQLVPLLCAEGGVVFSLSCDPIIKAPGHKWITRANNFLRQDRSLHLRMEKCRLQRQTWMAKKEAVSAVVFSYI